MRITLEAAFSVVPLLSWMGRGKPQSAAHAAVETPEAALQFEVLQCHGEHSVIVQVNALEKRLFSKSFALTGEQYVRCKCSPVIGLLPRHHMVVRPAHSHAFLAASAPG